MRLVSGMRLGPYEIVAPIGAGGMGEVYRAHDARLGREVALKVLPHAFTADPDHLRRFESEARAVALLNHPNVVALYDVGTADGAPYLVSELIDGATLREHLADGPQPLRRIVDWALQIAHGLAAAHEKGIVHRDLKPENLFVTKDRRIKILDFGLAKLRCGEPMPPAASQTATMPIDTAPGVVLGTMGYMAPEQVRGEACDHRADIFAFGAILYELLAGRRAFAAQTSVETMTAILRAEPPELPPERVVPPALDRIARRCLEKSPEDRFQSARDVGFALEAISMTGAASPPVAARPRGRRLPIVAAVVMLLAAAFAVGWWLGGRRTSSDASFSWRAVRLVNSAAQEVGPAISPDGKWIAYLSDARGRNDIWVRFVAGGEAVNLTAALDLDIQNSTNIGGLDISPDGMAIAFDADPKGAELSNFSVWVIPAPLGGTPRKLIDRGRAGRWSPDAKRIAYVHPGAAAGDELRVASANGENAQTIVPAQGGRHVHWPAWSHDGRYLYFITSLAPRNSEPVQISRVPSLGGAIEPVVRTSRRAIYPLPWPDGSGFVYAANVSSAELSLWWQPVRGAARPIIAGVGEYGEARVASGAADRMICTLSEPRQSLRTISLTEPGSPRLLTDSYHGDLDPNIAARRLVFSSSRSGDRAIWVADVAAGHQRPLTSGPYLDEAPAISPDGTRVAFVSDRSGRRGVWVVSIEGGAPRHVADADVLQNVSWSPDGRSLVYAAPAGDVPGLWIVSVDDGGIRRIAIPAGGHSPAWSPVEDLIAYLEPAPPGRGPATTLKFITSRGEVRLADNGRSPAADSARPTPRAGGTDWMAWDPTGRRLAGAWFGGATRSIVWMVEPHGDGLMQELTEFPVGTQLRGVTWAPDGRSIIVGAHEDRTDLVLLERQHYPPARNYPDNAYKDPR